MTFQPGASCNAQLMQCLASIYDPDHLCFRRTTYDDINGPGGTIYVVTLGPVGPLMYPDQISRYRAIPCHNINGPGINGPAGPFMTA